MSRILRRCVALAGIVALLFSTLSVAAYVCPADPAGSASMANMPDDCPDRDTGQPNLCKAHCSAGQQQTTTGAADVPPLPLVHGLLSSLLPAATAIVPATWGRAIAAPTRTTAPPIAIRNCCFRL